MNTSQTTPATTFDDQRQHLIYETLLEKLTNCQQQNLLSIREHLVLKTALGEFLNKLTDDPYVLELISQGLINEY